MENISKPVTNATWMKSTFLGWLLGVVLIIVLSSCLDAIGIGNMQFYVGAGMGTGVGLAQWLALRRRIALNGFWFLACFLGMSIPYSIVDLALTTPPIYKLTLCVAMGGLLTGVFQHWVLRRHYKKSFLWIPGSLIGWSLSACTIFIINYTMALRMEGSMNLLLALLNLVLILSGGIVLGWVHGYTFRNITAKSV